MERNGDLCVGWELEGSVPLSGRLVTAGSVGKRGLPRREGAIQPAMSPGADGREGDKDKAMVESARFA